MAFLCLANLCSNEMATYLEIYNLRQNGDLLARVMVACIKAAEYILVEADTVENHTNRISWAVSVMDNPSKWADRMLWSVLQNGTIQASGVDSTDSDIQYVVDSLIDRYSLAV